MLIDLEEATPATSGAKAATLARLHHAGLQVPPGFVIPISAYEQAIAGLDLTRAAAQGAHHARQLVEHALPAPELINQLPEAMSRIANPHSEKYLAVRSSATTEDGTDAAAAGQHDTVLAVRSPGQVAAAIRTCWASLWSDRAVTYRHRQANEHGDHPPAMAVLVQPLVNADVAGVMFTGATTRIEASWGLGDSIVSGQVTPDTWLVHNQAIIYQKIGAKSSRTDRVGAHLTTQPVPASDRAQSCLGETVVHDLSEIGHQIEFLLGGPQDVEWALAAGHLWILQARPITAGLPTTPPRPADPAHCAPDLTGTPASPGLAVGPARIIHGPDDFTRVRPGDVLICRTTDPAWTALFGLVAAVVTETGGVLSHAAIIAREQGLPAVLAVPNATTTLPDGATITVDGHHGHIQLNTDHK